MCACSSPPGTEEPCSADTGGLWLRVYRPTGHAEECPTNVTRSEAVWTSRDQCLLYGSKSRSIMYTFIYSNLHSHGYEDVTIHHQRTSKNTITLLNFPYIHSHIQSHSPRAPPWPSPPAFCGLLLAVNQYVVASPAYSFPPAGAIHQQTSLPCFFDSRGRMTGLSASEQCDVQPFRNNIRAWQTDGQNSNIHIDIAHQCAEARYKRTLSFEIITTRKLWWNIYAPRH